MRPGGDNEGAGCCSVSEINRLHTHNYAQILVGSFEPDIASRFLTKIPFKGVSDKRSIGCGAMDWEGRKILKIPFHALHLWLTIRRGGGGVVLIDLLKSVTYQN